MQVPGSNLSFSGTLLIKNKAKQTKCLENV